MQVRYPKQQIEDERSRVRELIVNGVFTEEKNEKDRFVGGLFATRDAGVIRSFLNALHFSTLADTVGSSLLSHYLAASKEALLEFFLFLRIFIYACAHGSYS